MCMLDLPLCTFQALFSLSYSGDIQTRMYFCSIVNIVSTSSALFKCLVHKVYFIA